MAALVQVAIVGAGPYGLSLAAYLQRRGVAMSIFGQPMESWLRHMPRGMLLKSDGFASNLCDFDDAYTLKDFCEERGLAYADEGIPVALENFCDYGLAFQRRFVPGLEPVGVENISRRGDDFALTLTDGRMAMARRVVMAVGLGAFKSVAAPLDQLPADRISHSFDAADPAAFAGKRVAVVGGGASAIDTATLIGEAGGDAHLISRRPTLRFGGKSTGERSLWQSLRQPSSGLGPGWRSRLSCDAPLVFHALPQSLRLRIVARHLGPSAGWPMRERMERAVKPHLGCEIAAAQVVDDAVELALSGEARTTLQVDHVVAATGFRVDIERLSLIDPALRAEINDAKGAPVLSRRFESSARGLYFVGPAAAASFGPLLRFAFGARFAARRLSAHLARAAVADAKSWRPDLLASDRGL